MVEVAIRLHLQRTLEEVDYLDLFWLSFMPGPSIEMPLVMLHLRWSQDKSIASMILLLDLSAAFYIIPHSIQNWLWGLRVGDTVLQSFPPFSVTGFNWH